ncbi:hypothetical protein D9M70_525150 [compost metagenome]
MRKQICAALRRNRYHPLVPYIRGQRGIGKSHKRGLKWMCPATLPSSAVPHQLRGKSRHNRIVFAAFLRCLGAKKSRRCGGGEVSSCEPLTKSRLSGVLPTSKHLDVERYRRSRQRSAGASSSICSTTIGLIKLLEHVCRPHAWLRSAGFAARWRAGG